MSLELFGIAVAILGLAAGTATYSAAGTSYTPSPGISLAGVVLAFVGCILHIVRV